MTVEELIERLKSYPPKSEVIMLTAEGATKIMDDCNFGEDHIVFLCHLKSDHPYYD